MAKVEVPPSHLESVLTRLGYPTASLATADPVSCSLIQRLVSDLLRTTSSLQSLKQLQPSAASQAASARGNEAKLHNDVVRLRSQIQEERKLAYRRQKKMETTVSDLKFLNTQCWSRVRQEIAKWEGEQGKLEELLKRIKGLEEADKGCPTGSTMAEKVKLPQSFWALVPRTLPQPFEQPVDVVQTLEKSLQQAQRERDDFMQLAEDLQDEIIFKLSIRMPRISRQKAQKQLLVLSKAEQQIKERIP